jgi:hypothetical protein
MGREDLGLENLQNAISAFIRESDWVQFHSPKNALIAPLESSTVGYSPYT